jgi:hypothetical protein
MTKAGIQIGLLYQEPFEARIDKDAYKLQKNLLLRRFGRAKKFYLTIDSLIVIVSVISLIVIFIGALYGLI